VRKAETAIPLPEPFRKGPVTSTPLGSIPRDQSGMWMQTTLHMAEVQGNWQGRPTRRRQAETGLRASIRGHGPKLTGDE
jgi:hypothetical protein